MTSLQIHTIESYNREIDFTDGAREITHGIHHRITRWRALREDPSILSSTSVGLPVMGWGCPLPLTHSLSGKLIIMPQRLNTLLRRRRNQRYRRILNVAGFEVCNLKLKGGGHLLLKSGTDANPDVLQLKAQV